MDVKDKKGGAFTISAINKANEKLIQIGNISNYIASPLIAAIGSSYEMGHIIINSMRAGRLHQINLTDEKIKEAYAKALESVSQENVLLDESGKKV